MLNHLKTWWTAHAVIAAGVVGFLKPSVATWAGNHPGSTIAAVLLLVVAAVKTPAN